MVFVEGKLQSWGRAETVIIILDTEADQLKDVVDCSLDDIVEAVKNCGDRKRSLGYLKQECGICFSYYPMNKVNWSAQLMAHHFIILILCAVVALTHPYHK